MELTLLRYNNCNGIGGILLIDGLFMAHTVEPINHIPTGRYEIKLRTDSSPMNDQYKKKFGASHKGMLWLQNVPQREWIYLHYGNEPANSEGCILVGASAMEKSTTKSNGQNVVFTGSSVATYEVVYDDVLTAIEADEPVFITITNITSVEY